MMVNDWSVYTPLWAIVVAVALGIAAWILGLWLMQHTLLIEAENAIRHFFGLWRFGFGRRVVTVAVDAKRPQQHRA
jgi:hypothetical protein